MTAAAKDTGKDQKRPMIVLTGPTAVGKTKLSIALAEAVDGEILSADSVQVYRHMDIGSAKITREEMRGIPHHMIDILEPWEPFNVVIFQQKCLECLEGIYARGHVPIVAGGTGFYIQALLKGVDFTESQEDTGYRADLERLAREKGPAFLHRMLAEADPASAEAIHENNVRRTIRALEYHHLTGRPISAHNEKERGKSGAYRSCYFVLNDLRQRLYERIDRRVDEMMERGLADEVRRLREMGCTRDMVSMQALGYKELLAWMDGEATLDEAVERIKRDTRHFAKRQLTWFRREQDVIWVDKERFQYEEGRILGFLLEQLRKEGVIFDERRQ